MIGFAQVKPSFGIRAGLSSAGIKGDAVTSLQNILDYTDGMITTSNRTGFYAGAYSSIPVSEIFSVEPSIYYSQKGYKLLGELNLKGVEFLGLNNQLIKNNKNIKVMHASFC